MTDGVLALKQPFGALRHILLGRFVYDGDVLDVGCGTGHNLFLLAHQVQSITGIDLNEERIGVVKKRLRYSMLKNVHVVQDDIFKHRFEKKFDKIVCTEFLEHITDDDRMVKRISSLLKKEGYLFVTVPARKMLFSWIEDIRTTVGDGDHVRPGYTSAEMKGLLERNGLQVLYIGYKAQFFSSFLQYTTSLIGIKKGLKITSDAKKTQSFLLRLYLFVWPFLEAVCRLETALFPRDIQGGFVFCIARKV